MAKRKQLPGDLDPISGEGSSRLKKGGWLILPLGLLAALSLYVLARNFPNIIPGSLQGSFFSAPFSALLMTLFSVLFIYKTVRRIPQHILAKIVAYILTFLFIIGVVLMINASGHGCTFAGGPVDCTSAQIMPLWLVFYNPWVTPVVTVLSLVGIIMLLLKRK